MRSVGRLVRRVMRRGGLDVYRHMAGGRLVPMRIKAIPAVGPLRASRRRRVPSTFEIDIDDCTSLAGFSYRGGGWNPHVATLREFQANPSLRYEDSTLYRLFHTFAPKTLQELFLEDVAEPMPPLSRLPAVRGLYRYVWTLSPAQIRGVSEVAEEDLRGHHYFGPMPLERGQAQFARLLDTYRSIEEEGFRPDRYGQVTGYFVADDSSYRFVIGAGNHRIAALKVLGQTSLPVALSRSHPAVVHRAALPSWTVERGGPFEPDTVHALFEKFMNEDGLGKAQRIGALDETR